MQMPYRRWTYLDEVALPAGILIAEIIVIGEAGGGGVSQERERREWMDVAMCGELAST